MKVALVYDRVNKIGGAERVLTALHTLWPEAPLFTSVYDPIRAPWARTFDVKTTFLQHIPFAKSHHEWFAWLTPFAFGSLSLDGYDVVISVTSAEAKSIITKPETLHICYCLTPTRYLWSGERTYTENTGFGIFHTIAKTMFSVLLPALRDWDQVASQRPDRFIAISKRVEERIRYYYKRTADEVIYPPVDTDFFRPSTSGHKDGDYYLFVSRLVPYKRADIVVGACSHLQKRLIVIGNGSEKSTLRTIAGPAVQFINDNLTDRALVRYYQNCRAFLFAGDEDFGIVAGEAQASGKPVIAYAQSGVSEIVTDGKTGLLYASQSKKGLEDAIIRFEKMKFSSSECRKNALRFSNRIFQKAIKGFVEREFQKLETTL